MTSLIIISTIFLFCMVSGQYEYDQVFADIKICGTDKQAYPFCASVDESPIHIQKSKLKSGDRIDCDEIDWDYNDEDTFIVEKKEHTIEVLAKDVAKFENPVDPQPDAQFNIEIETKVEKFCLEQVHFHWDDDDDDLGSEHKVNGKKWPLEAHFVHYNCERGSVSCANAQYPTPGDIAAARLQGIDTHELAVIAVFFDIEDEANPTIDRILDASELIKQQEKEECDGIPDEPRCVTPKETNGCDNSKEHDKPEGPLQVKMSGIDFNEILTDDILENGYYEYEGSLTTPPCTDDVRWFVMRKASYISKAQILRYRDITRPCNPDKQIAPNWRPLQENINPVYKCNAENDDDNDGDNDGDNDDDDDEEKQDD